MEKVKFFVRIDESKKTGRAYAMLCADLGYTVKALTFDSQLIAEIMRVSVADLMSLDKGKYDI